MLSKEDIELAEVLTKFYPPEPRLKVSNDTATPEGRRWRLHILTKDRGAKYSVVDDKYNHVD